LTVPTSPAGSAAANTSLSAITVPTGITLPAGITLPDGATIPTGLSIPTDFTVPQGAIDQLVATLAASGLNIDKTCLEDLLKDDGFRKLVTAGGTPSAEAVQKLTACIKK
jgi:hypothetical protein